MKPLIPDLDKMRVGADYVFTVRIRNWVTRLRPITISEHMAINDEVVKILMETPVEMRNRVNENYLLAKKFLQQASKLDPEGSVEPSLNDYIMDRMSVEEVLFAYDQYIEGKKLCDPSLEKMTLDELNALVGEVKKNPTLLTELSTWQQKQIAEHFLTQGD